MQWDGAKMPHNTRGGLICVETGKRGWCQGKMLTRGWKSDQLVLIFLNRRKLPQYLQTTLMSESSRQTWSWDNVGVVHKLETWLGPTLWEFAKGLEDLSRDDTLQIIIPGQGDPATAKAAAQAETNEISAKHRIPKR